MRYLIFSIGYNLRWQRLLYIFCLVTCIQVVSDGFKFLHPWWYILGFYGLSWMAIVLVDTVLKRFLRNWPKNEA